MLAPCLGKFGGIETFCLTLIEDLIHKGASVRLLRKKVEGFMDDGSIQKNENEIRSSWTETENKRFTSQFVSPRDSLIKKAIKECDLAHLHNPMVEGAWHAKKFNKPLCDDYLQLAKKGDSTPDFWPGGGQSAKQTEGGIYLSLSGIVGKKTGGKEVLAYL